MHPTIVEMYVAARQDDLRRGLRDARRARSLTRRHLLRRTPATDR